MKKFRFVAAVSAAVLTMSAQAMAAPLTTNATAAQLNCQNITALTNCNITSSPSIQSVRQNCLNSIDIESILSQLNYTNKNAGTIITNLNCNLGNILENAGSNCNGSDCTGTDCTGTDCTGSDCTGSDCTDSTNCTPATSTPVTSTPVTSKPVTNTPVTSTPVASKPVTNTPGTSTPVTSTPVIESPANNSSNSNGSEQAASSVSAYAQQVVNLVNAERAKAGLSPLQLDLKVTQAAQVRAKEIKTSFSHTRPDGRSCFTTLDEAGAAYRGAGENIAIGQKTPEQVMNDWMNSPGHKANILNPNFKYIGVGIDGSAWTQLFTY